ncbi:MAG: hypothetical protein HKN67_12815 [Saprospiraceae bacterium]|nr:hypothetical protein [Saprospiraceae bacterium]
MKDLQGIKNGEIYVLFRKWKTPRVKSGSVIHSPVGQLKIIDIKCIGENEITRSLIADSGLELSEILNEIKDVNDKTLYLVRLEYHGEDPRISLRNQTNLSKEEIGLIISKLENLDKRSSKGPWTKHVLDVIQSNPKQKAALLADLLKVDKKWFKTNVRKLKNLGLTISHGTGYSLSPRGKVLIKKLPDE